MLPRLLSPPPLTVPLLLSAEGPSSQLVNHAIADPPATVGAGLHTLVIKTSGKCKETSPEDQGAILMDTR